MQTLKKHPVDSEEYELQPIVIIQEHVRSGSYLLHSRLDGHPSIIVLLEAFDIVEFYLHHEKDDNMEILANKLLESLPDIFCSKNNNYRRINCLGKNACEYAEVDINKFKMQFLIEVALNAKMTMHAFIIAFYRAYQIAKNLKLTGVKYLLIHLHSNKHLALIKEIFSAPKYLVTLSNPIRSIISWQFYHENYNNIHPAKIYHPNYELNVIKKIFSMGKFIESIDGNFFIVRIQENSNPTPDFVEKIFNYLNLEVSSNFSTPTFGGKEWDRDLPALMLVPHRLNASKSRFTNKPSINAWLLPWEEKVLLHFFGLNKQKESIIKRILTNAYVELLAIFPFRYETNFFFQNIFDFEMKKDVMRCWLKRILLIHKEMWRRFPQTDKKNGKLPELYMIIHSLNSGSYSKDEFQISSK